MTERRRPRFAEKHPYLFAVLFPALFLLVMKLVGSSLTVNIPTDKMLAMNFTDFYWAEGSLRFILSQVLFGLMKALGAYPDGLLRREGTLKGLRLGWAAFLFAGLYLGFAFANVDTSGFRSPDMPHLLSTLLFVLGIGCFEELLFRGAVLPVLIRRLGGTKKGVWGAMLLSSLLFGLAHIVNAIGGTLDETNLMQIGLCVIYGLFLAVVYLRCKTLWPPILLHALIDLPIFFLLAILTPGGLFRFLMALGAWQGIDTSQITAVFFGLASPMLLSAFWMLRKVEPTPQPPAFSTEPCPCCGYYAMPIHFPGHHPVCPVCFWEYDPAQHRNPELDGGENQVSLCQARENYNAYGACNEEVLPHVRDPLPEEIGKTVEEPHNEILFPLC